MEPQKWYKNAFFPTYNAVLFLAFGFVLLNYYGMVHWEIIGNNYAQLDGELKDSLFSLMAKLSAYRLCGIVALIFSIWGCGCEQRWAFIINILLGLMSCLMIVVSM